MVRSLASGVQWQRQLHYRRALGTRGIGTRAVRELRTKRLYSPAQEGGERSGMNKLPGVLRGRGCGPCPFCTRRGGGGGGWKGPKQTR